MMIQLMCTSRYNMNTAVYAYKTFYKKSVLFNFLQPLADRQAKCLRNNTHVRHCSFVTQKFKLVMTVLV